MVGVSSPLLRTPGALKFHTGFLLGVLASSGFLTILLVPVGIALSNVPHSFRAIGVAVFAALCAWLDFRDRTPYVWRQVPQRLSLQGLSPGSLGFVYGLDIGLWFTTQKVASLLWVAIAGAVLLGSPGVIAATLLSAAMMHVIAVAALSGLDQRALTGSTFWGWNVKGWTRTAQLVAGVMLAVTSGHAVQEALL